MGNRREKHISKAEDDVVTLPDEGLVREHGEKNKRGRPNNLPAVHDIDRIYMCVTLTRRLCNERTWRRR